MSKPEDHARGDASGPEKRGRRSFPHACAYIILCALAFLLPVAIVPLPAVSFAFSKSMVVILLSLASFLCFVFSCLKDGHLSWPRTYMLPALLIAPVVFLVAAILSPAPIISLIGQGSEIGTFASIGFLTLLFFLASVVPNSRARVLRVYCALLVAFALLSVHELLRLFIGPGFLDFGILTTGIGNLLGKWNDVGIFYGLAAVMTMLALQMLPFRLLGRSVLYGILAVCLFFLALVDFVNVWLVLGFFSIVLGVYALTAGRALSKKAHSGGETFTRNVLLQQFSFSTVLVFLVCSIFLFSNGFMEDDPLGSFFSETFGITHLEARPSWASTVVIIGQSLRENMPFGSGPNRFNTLWQLHRPEGINGTLFWSTSFNSGIGHIPTFAATTGVVGLAVWIVFFCFFIASGLRSLFISREDRFTHFLVLSSFLAALYCWIFMVLYIPSMPLVALAFLFTGLYVAMLAQEKIIKIREISFSGNPKLGFLVSLLCMITVIAGVGGGFLLSKRFVAAYYFQKAANVLDKNNDLAGARALLEKALSLHRFDGYYRLLASVNLAELNALLSRADISDAALEPEFRRLFTEAKQNATAAVDYDETHYQNWVTLGGVYGAVLPLGIDEKVYMLARDGYDHAIALSPRDPSLYLSLARFDAVRGDLDGARENIRQALERKNNYTEAIFFLSQVEVTAGNLDVAIQSVEAASLIAPDDPTVFFQLGLLKYNANNIEGAVVALERAIELNGSYANARYFLGLAYERLGRYSDAIVQFVEIEKFNPDNKEIKMILGNLRAGRKAFQNEDQSQPAVAENPLKRSALPIQETLPPERSFVPVESIETSAVAP